MGYEVFATSGTPQLVIFLINVSSSMKTRYGQITRMQLAQEVLRKTLVHMLIASTKGHIVAPKYRVAIIVYSDKVTDVFGGIKPIDEIMSIISRQGNEIKFTPTSGSNTAEAFLCAERLLVFELPHIQDHPAPIIMHLTDGSITGEDPEPIVKRIMSLSVMDGNILVENVLLSDKILEGIADLKDFAGITPNTPLQTDLAKKLREMSSTFPNSYLWHLQTLSNTRLNNNSVMFIPASHHELVEYAFQIALATSFRIDINASQNVSVGSAQGNKNSPMSDEKSDEKYDVFISHASEDKQIIARPLAQELIKHGFKVWIDEYELTVGDALRREIDRGLTKSRFGIVILSPSFFEKEWPQRELDSLVARDDGKEKVILPIWHNVTQKDVVRYSPLLATKLAVSTDKGIVFVAQEIIRAIQREQKK